MLIPAFKNIRMVAAMLVVGCEDNSAFVVYPLIQKEYPGLFLADTDEDLTCGDGRARAIMQLVNTMGLGNQGKSLSSAGIHIVRDPLGEFAPAYCTVLLVRELPPGYMTTRAGLVQASAADWLKIVLAIDSERTVEIDPGVVTVTLSALRYFGYDLKKKEA